MLRKEDLIDDTEIGLSEPTRKKKLIMAQAVLASALELEGDILENNKK
jgi:hypothetical protein